MTWHHIYVIVLTFTTNKSNGSIFAVVPPTDLVIFTPADVYDIIKQLALSHRTICFCLVVCGNFIISIRRLSSISIFKLCVVSTFVFPIMTKTTCCDAK